jgi:Tat protein secretion system quality control protein TatD with DNase activity
VAHVAECIAELRGMTVDAVADLTSRNFSALFRV